MSRLRGQPENSEYIQQELAEIVANHEYELKAIGVNTGYVQSWLNCFKGSITDPASNLRRTFIGVSAQMMQQFTGINFIFYFGTVFFQSLGKFPHCLHSQALSVAKSKQAALTTPSSYL
jgi:MFS transporter, SP family, sugar:H+ symporter